MTIEQRKILVSKTAPAGGIQDVESTGIGVDDTNNIVGPNYKIAPDAGAENQVLTVDSSGDTVKLKAIPRSNSTMYRANTAITAPPSNGQIRWDNATQNAATKLFLSGVNSEGIDILEFLKLTVVPGSRVLFQKDSDQGQFQEFTVNVVADQGTYLELDVILEGSDGGNFGNNNNVLALFVAGTSQASSTELISSATTLTRKSVSENIYRVDLTSGEYIVTLPPVAEVNGQRFVIVKIDNSNNKLTVTGNGAETINGESSDRVVSQYDSLTLLANGAEWYILNEHFNSKTLFVDRDGSGFQVIPTGISTVVEFDRVVVDTIDAYDDITNYDYTPGNAVFSIIVSVQVLQLDINDFVEVCLRKNGTPIACNREHAGTSNQDITVNLSTLDSNVDPVPGVYDITVEHDQGGNLNLSDDPLSVFWKMIRVA